MNATLWTHDSIAVGEDDPTHQPVVVATAKTVLLR